jgi:CPA2 family monovalent cation:H+ antiporter-2
LLAAVGKAIGRRADRGAPSRVAQALHEGASSKVVIFGFGRVGRMVAEMLGAHNVDFVAIDSDIDTVAQAAKAGIPAVFGDVAHPELIGRVHRGNPSAFILTMDNPVLVGRLAKQLRQAFPALPIIARARDSAHAAKLYKAGVTDAVPETLEASLQLSEAALVDLGLAMGPVIASIHEKRDELRARIKAEANLEEEPRLGRRRARDSQPPEKA